MTPEMQVAYINAQIIGAQCELAAFNSANQEALARGEDPPYKENDFKGIPDRFGLGHNTVIGYFTGR
jgi:hypothetical protein